MSAPLDTRLSRALGQGPPTGAWFLHGDAIRLRDEAAQQLVEAAVDPATRDFNYDQFHAEDVTDEQLAATLAMPPMMAERRVVFVRDVERLGTKARAVLKKAAAAAPPDLALIVTARIPKGSRAAFYRDLKQACRTLEWNTPRAAEIPGWIHDRARRRWKLDLSPASAQWIAGAVGSDLSTLDAELEKLASLPADRRTDADIRAIVPRTHRIDRWSWLDLVASRDYPRALRELENVLTSERGVGLVAGLVEQHLLLGLALEAGAAGLRAALSETGRGYLSWKANAYAKQARAWTVHELDHALRALHRADRHLKSGRGDRAALAEMLLELGQGEEPREMTASRRSRGGRPPRHGSRRAWALALLAGASSWGLSVPSAAQAAQAASPVDLDHLEARIEAGRFEGAAEAIERWFATEARNAARGDVLRARYLRARLLADPDSARAELLSVAMNGGSRHGSRAWLRLAQLDLALDEPARAAADLERLRADHARSAEAVESWYWTARTFEDRGLLDRACEAWQRGAAEGRRVGATKIALLAETSALGCAPGAPRFAIQVAAFSRRDPAEEMRGQLEAAGFFSRVVEYDGLHRVRLGRFARPEAAESLARRLRGAGFEPAVIPIVS